MAAREIAIMPGSGKILGGADDEQEPFPSKLDFLVQSMSTLTNEVHENTVAIGRLTAGQAKQEASFRSFRDRMKSIPAEAAETAEDTARHEIAKLKEQLDRERQATKIAELEATNVRLLKDQGDVERLAAERRKRIWSVVRWALGIIGPPAGLLLERYAHVLPH